MKVEVFILVGQSIDQMRRRDGREDWEGSRERKEKELRRQFEEEEDLNEIKKQFHMDKLHKEVTITFHDEVIHIIFASQV